MFSYALKPEIGNLVVLVDQFHKFCRAGHVPETVEGHLKIALDELVSNTIYYGNPDPDSVIQISATVTGQTMNMEIVDFGIPFDPFSRDNPDTSMGIDERKIGGLGIYLVKKLMDHASYQRVDNRNVVRLRIDLKKDAKSNNE